MNKNYSKKSNVTYHVLKNLPQILSNKALNNSWFNVRHRDSLCNKPHGEKIQKRKTFETH